MAGSALCLVMHVMSPVSLEVLDQVYFSTHNSAEHVLMWELKVAKLWVMCLQAKLGTSGCSWV